MEGGSNGEDFDRSIFQTTMAMRSSSQGNYSFIASHQTRRLETAVQPNSSFSLQNLENLSLEPHLARLDLSNPPRQSSYFLSNDLLNLVSGTTPAGSVIDSPIGLGLSPWSIQQTEQPESEFSRFTIQNATPMLDSFSLPHDKDGCGFGCSCSHGRNGCRLILVGFECGKMLFMPYSSGNQFTLDSQGSHRGESVNLRLHDQNDSRTWRSALHDHYRNSFKNSSLEELRGQIMSMAKHQDGCRFLQKKLEERKPEEIKMILFEVINNVGELMMDSSGNYLAQKLIEVCNAEQRTTILRRVSRNYSEFGSICVNVHGSRTIQKLVETFTTPQQISEFISALRRVMLTLIKDMNGGHVIKHCLRTFSIEQNQYLLNGVANHCVDIAKDRSGCCVLQDCIENARGGLRKRLENEITTNALMLAEDPFGNYVVQFLLGQRMSEVNSDLLRQLEGSYASLSTNKFGSNVVEKCLTGLAEEQCTQIIEELISSTDFPMLLVDPYGNYVIQKALKASEGLDIYKILADRIRDNAPSMQSHVYGKNILHKLK